MKKDVRVVQDLVGAKVKAAFVNEDKNVVYLDTESGVFELSWHGDCCSHCFLANIGGSDSLVDAEIISVIDTEWINTGDMEYGEVVESMGSTIQTSKGTVTLETRLEHNGYYGGWIDVAKIDKIPTSSKFHIIKPLIDF